jgi:hypothetical protein
MHESRPRPDQVENSIPARLTMALAMVPRNPGLRWQRSPLSWPRVQRFSAISSASEGSARSVSNQTGLALIRPARDDDVLPAFRKRCSFARAVHLRGAHKEPMQGRANAQDELQYRGRLDASRMPPIANAGRDLFEALKMIAETGHGQKEQLPSMGCSIKWRR